MRKLLKSQKGSSFAYILVVVSILLILTGSLITMTVANYRLGLIKGGRNTAFYFADGAIDVALAQVEELSHRAEIYASEKIEKADFKKEEKWVEFNKWLENNTLAETDDDVDGLESEDSASDDKKEDDKEEDKKVFLTAEEASALYSEAVKKEFDKHYLIYLLEATDVKEDYILLKRDDDKSDYYFVHENTMTFEKGKDTLDSDYLLALQTSKFKPTGGESFDEIKDLITKVTPLFDEDENTLRLTIETSGEYNIYNKGVQVAVDMKPPEYHYITVTDMVRKEMHTNDVLENALTAKGDIIVTGGEVATYGDVYALGTFNDSIASGETGYSNSVNHLNKGGVVVGYDPSNNFLGIASGMINTATSGCLKVNGNIKTASSVKMGYSNSIIHAIEDKSTALGGYLYADSYVTPSDVTGADLNIDASMFIMDDVYITGDNSHVKIGDDAGLVGNENNKNIDDTLFTFLDGGVVEIGGKTIMSPDLSSSIRIGKKSASSDSTSIETDYLYVPGVAYIDIYRNDEEGTHYYRTGEAFTTEKNFFFYQKEFEEQEERTESIIYTDGETEFSLVEYVDEAGKITDSPAYKAEHFLNSVYEEYSKPKDERDDDIVDSKDKSIMTVHSLKRDDIAAGLDGDQSDYKEDNNYTLGVFMANGRIYNPSRVKIDPGTYITDFRDPSNLVSDRMMNLLGHRDYRHGTLKTTSQVGENDVEMLDQYIDFERAKDYITRNTNGLLVTVTDKDVYINTGKKVSGAIVYEGSKDIRGLVATKGNIYIGNDDDETPLTFNGTLIAGGDIVFYGKGKKVIDNIDENIELENKEIKDGPVPLESRALVYSTVGSSPILMETFHTDLGRKLVVKKDGDSYTRSIFFNLALEIVDKNFAFSNGQPSIGKVDRIMSSIPTLDGITKEKELKGYDLVYWREIKPTKTD